jgi:hypothetical protein
MEKDWKLKWQCPRCKKFIKGHPALSRRDNKTNICSECGIEEAMWDFFVYKERKWVDDKE